MMRRWASTTRYTLQHNTASITDNERFDLCQYLAFFNIELFVSKKIPNYKRLIVPIRLCILSIAYYIFSVHCSK